MSGHTHENPHAGQGMVMLDIGGDVGALVVTMPRSMLGEEVDIRPADAVEDGGHAPHVAVVDRPVAGGAGVPSLVYPELAAGSYALSLKGTRDVVLTATVHGAEVTQTAWPER
jgi:hypothetical protein